MSYDPSKSVWLNPDIEYLFNADIIEYDIRDAGFNLIKQYKLLPPDKIEWLNSFDKKTRHIMVGKIQGKDKEFSKALMSKFAEIRAIFIGVNKLTDDRIISVKKDAIFTIGKCERSKFGKIEFASKNEYSSYIRFVNNKNIEIYFKDGVMEVKGIGDSALNRHRLYMLEFIQTMFRYIENKNYSARRYLMKFIDQYKMMELDDEFYIEFNNISKDYNPIFNFQKVVIPFTQILLKEL